MDLRNKIDNDLKISIKNKDKVSLGILRVLKGEISRNESPSNLLNDKEIIKIITKLVKNLDTLEDVNSKNEVLILKKYLPKLLTQKEIEKIIDDIILDLPKPLTMKDIGKIMQPFNKNHEGKADNKLVIDLIKQKIN